MQETLGLDILALVSASRVPYFFIKRLLLGIFKVFLKLIKQFYPDAIKFG